MGVDVAAATLSRDFRAAFEQAEVPHLFLKGQPVGALAWDNPFLKTSWDIDVLVLPDDVARAAVLLPGLGLELLLPDDGKRLVRWHRRRKESVWRSPAGLHLELHSRLADAPQLLPALDACSPRQEVTVLPGLALPTLADEELFAYLCVHGASSAWFRLKWIADFAAIIGKRSGEELEHLISRADRLGAGRAVAQALLLTAGLFAPPASPRLQRQLERNSAARWLCRTALRQLLHESEPTRRPLGTATIHLSQLRLLLGPRFATAELARQLRAPFAR